MDPTSIATALLGAQTRMMQLDVATRLMRMNADNSASIVKLVDSAQQSIAPLSDLPANIGANLDVSA